MTLEQRIEALEPEKNKNGNHKGRREDGLFHVVTGSVFISPATIKGSFNLNRIKNTQ